MRRQVYVETLESVVFPGFETLGVDTTEARRWLGEQRATARTGPGSLSGVP